MSQADEIALQLTGPSQQGLGLLQQHNIAAESSIVPPIGIERGNPISAAGVVDFYDHEVVTIVNLVCDLEVEGREAAFVFAQGFAVEIGAGKVVGGSETDENAGVLPLVIGK